MIKFTQGNLLDADVDALVNTVNTVGVMGKGIALMFKEAFPENFRAYARACKAKELHVGKMFVTERGGLIGGPKWIINFPTKDHWRSPSKMEWIESGLSDLKRWIETESIRSVALPPLGSGNGGLNWRDVRPKIEEALGSLPNVDVIVYEPTEKYQNVSKREGVEKLTPARALVAELIRRYWILGFECTILEVQKLAYFLERGLENSKDKDLLNFQFSANKFGPFAPRLTHLLDSLDGSYLHCSKRLSDAGALDVIWFDEPKKDKIAAYLKSEGKSFKGVLDRVTEVIEGFESPLGMEAIATVDWVLHRDKIDPSVESVRKALANWAGGSAAAKRKQRIFDDHLIEVALDRLRSSALYASGADSSEDGTNAHRP
jgi:O-acetyl-ADP-ribose deacetylase (regulator of RNase III)